MAYDCTLYDLVGDIDADEWRAAGANGLMMDLRFLTVVERTMANDLRMWHAIFRDGARPMACASFGLYRADLTALATPAVGGFLRRFRAVFPKFAYMNVLFCGLPISIGQKSIGLASDCQPRLFVKTIVPLISEIARKNRAFVIGIKEFPASDCNLLDSLIDHDYSRVPLPASYRITKQHANFSEYRASLKSSYRRNIERSLKKLESSGLQVEQIQDGGQVAAAFTDEMHSLYLNVAERAEDKLEILPAAFFRSLALEFPDAVSLICVKKADRVIGFTFNIRTPDSEHFLFCGIDYEFNRSFDTYFNMIYVMMDGWYGQKLSVLQMGQTSDDFKTRLGCIDTPLFAYVKATGIMKPIMRANINSIFPPLEPAPARNIFKGTKSSADN